MLPKNKLRERRLERLRVFPSFNMGVMGGNVLKSWEDGTLPPKYDPTKPTTAHSLQRNWRTTSQQ